MCELIVLLLGATYVMATLYGLLLFAQDVDEGGEEDSPFLKLVMLVAIALWPLTLIVIALYKLCGKDLEHEEEGEW